MNKNCLIPFNPWQQYGQSFSLHILKPKYVGHIEQSEADDKALFRSTGKAGSLQEGQMICWYWLINPKEGTVEDLRFEIFSDSLTLGLAEAIASEMKQKNYQQARSIKLKQLNNIPQNSAFDLEKPFDLIMQAAQEAADSCLHIPILKVPFEESMDSEEEHFEDSKWFERDKKEQIEIIEKVLTEHVRPYLEMDGGGVDIIDVIDGSEILIRYLGNCSSCFSGVGATLQYMQETLQNRIHPDLKVKPQIDQDMFNSFGDPFESNSLF